MLVWAQLYTGALQCGQDGGWRGVACTFCLHILQASALRSSAAQRAAVTTRPVQVAATFVLTSQIEDLIDGAWPGHLCDDVAEVPAVVSPAWLQAQGAPRIVSPL